MSEKISSSKLKLVLHESADEVEKGDDCGISLEKLNIGPRKKLLVLDLGGLLLHRAHFRNKASIPKFRKCDETFGNFLVFKRPFCDEFLKFCFDNFEVGLWSSAMGLNVDGVLDFTMRTLRRRLLFVWNQSECTDTGFYDLEKKERPIFLKEMKKLWDKDKSSLPWPKGRYSSSNTLLIDDTPYKALLNPVVQMDIHIGPRGELRLFLEGLVEADDVPTYVKEHRIGQPEITFMHQDWKFYSKIIEKFCKGSSSAGTKNGSSSDGTKDGMASAGSKDGSSSAGTKD
ncbi:hypothetical protein HHK36_018090 [Tetracentron sinense]|uniref:Mitochondrial import inner membrane translocase subunit TIM50 n=1 Tax=Tetracentron sinense TaxID=13715 RepID=A0A835DD69_TETSI|nr:hypothetical protein HHK36_018090 [Tetracentron sinense]